MFRLSSAPNARYGWCRLALFVAALACSRRTAHLPPNGSTLATDARAPASTVAVPLATPVVEDLVTPYAPGRWRLATAEELERSLVWLAHIQVSYRDVTPHVASFHLSHWTPNAENPERSRLEAFRRAKSLAERAQAAPEAFGALAREFSDDVASRDLGGELGAMTALRLARWPELLDAWASLREGEVSRVVESEFGYHVLVRRPPPDAATVSGARIVIGYDDAPWLPRSFPRHPIPARSRRDALTLADGVYKQLAAHPSEFANAVQEYSEHRDALRDGDLGEWSTREASPWPREIEVLRRLAIGEIAPPIDSPLGVQILMRTPTRHRKVYAMAALELSLDPSATAEDPRSLESTSRQLAEISDALAANPARFADERARLCCEATQTWVEGRGSVFAEAALARLAPFELARTPVVIEPRRIALLQRLEAVPPTAPSVSFDLPQPKAPNIEWLTATYGTAALLGAVNERASQSLELDASEAQLLGSDEHLTTFLEAKGQSARLQAFRQYLEHLERALGAERFAQYERVFESYVEERLLRTRRIRFARDSKNGLRSHGWPVL